MSWDRQRLDAVVKERLSGSKVVVVANREPFIHYYDGEDICWMRPASGLTTALDPVMAEVSHELLEPLRDWPHAWVENKGLGLTVHYRAVPCEHHAAMLARVDQVLEGALCRGSIRTRKGPMAIEVIPDFGETKGTAIREILKRLPYRNPFVLFAGDSENDVEAFGEVLCLGGMAIGAGQDFPKGPQYGLKSPQELAALLEHLGHELEGLAPRISKKTSEESWLGLWPPFFR